MPRRMKIGDLFTATSGSVTRNSHAAFPRRRGQRMLYRELSNSRHSHEGGNPFPLPSWADRGRQSMNRLRIRLNIPPLP